MAPPTPVVRFGRKPERVPVQLGSSPAQTGTGVRVVDTGQILEFKWDSGSSETEPEPEVKEAPNLMISYVLIGGLALIVIGAAYYFKVVRKKKEDFIEDEDEDEEDNEEYENEDEESEEDTEEDFFDEQEE